MRHALIDGDEGFTQRVSHICLCNLVTSSSDNTPVAIKYGQRIVDPLSNQQYRVEDEQNAGGVYDHYEIPLTTFNTQPTPTGD